MDAPDSLDLLFFSFFLSRSGKDRPKMSSELAEVSRRMDEIVAQAAAEGALDEQFTQLRELEVRGRIGEGEGGRNPERARRAVTVAFFRDSESQKNSQHFSKKLEKKRKKKLPRTSPTRTLSPRSRRSTSPTPRKSLTSSRRRSLRSPTRRRSERPGPPPSTPRSTSSRAPRPRSGPPPSPPPASGCAPPLSRAISLPSATCSRTRSGASSSRCESGWASTSSWTRGGRRCCWVEEEEGGEDRDDFPSFFSSLEHFFSRFFFSPFVHPSKKPTTTMTRSKSEHTIEREVSSPHLHFIQK